MRHGLRLRRFSPIDRNYPIYEVLDGRDILLSIARTDDGDYELWSNPVSTGRVLPLESVTQLIAEAKRLLTEE